MRRPSNNRITLAYGATEAPYSKSNPHLGTDFSFQPDDQIYAPEAGTIVFVGWMGSAGNAVELQGAGGRKWRMCHMSSFNVYVGQQVGEGHVLGIMGETGTWPDGSKSAYGRHLHLILFINGNRTDPMSVLGSVGGGTQLMTPNFISRTYWMVQGRLPSQDEINFHMANSNPESFINGFGDAALWLTQQGQLNQLQAKVNELNATLAHKAELEAQDNANDAAVQQQLSAANERISSLTVELEDARKNITTGQKDTPAAIQPTTEKKPNLLTQILIKLFAPKNK